MPKQNPIEMPMNSSFSTTGTHCSALSASIGIPAIEIGSATIARLTMKLLRTIAGTVSAVSSGSIRNAPAIRGRVSPSAIITSPTVSKGINRPALSPDQAGEFDEDLVGVGVQRSADQRASNEQRDHDHRELDRIGE